MITSLDNSNINNNQASKNITNLTISNKAINNINLENEYFNIKNNTINNFYLSTENKILNKTLKVIRPISHNHENNLEKNELNNNKNNNLSYFVKELDFNNLNDYYQLQSSIFLKKNSKIKFKILLDMRSFLK